MEGGFPKYQQLGQQNTPEQFENQNDAIEDNQLLKKAIEKLCRQIKTMEYND